MKHYLKMKRVTALLLVMILALGMMPIAMAESFSAFVKSGTMDVYSNGFLIRKTDTLKQYSVVTVTDFSGDVAKIRYQGKSGYAEISDMMRVDAVAVKGVVNTATRAYSAPSSDSASVQMPKGTEVNVVEVKGDWALIEKNGQGAYAYARYLTTEGDVIERSLLHGGKNGIMNSDTRVYRYANTSSHSWRVKKGMKVRVYGSENGWTYIQNPSNGAYAYAKSGEVTVEGQSFKPGEVLEGKPAYMTRSTKVYTRASTSASYWRVKAGMKVNYVRKEGSWVVIQNPSCGVYAYAKEDDVALIPDVSGLEAREAKMARNTNVYAEARTSSRAFPVKKNMRVLVYDVDGDWTLIQNPSNAMLAYAKTKDVVLSGSVETPEPTATPAPTLAPSKGEPAVMTRSTRVYEQPNTSSRYWNVKKGMEVLLFEVEGDWARIQNPVYGVFAYAKKDEVKRKGEPDPTPTPDLSDAVPAVVLVEKTTVYAEADDKSQARGTLSRGTRVNLIQVKNGWANIERNGSYGWCRSYALVAGSSLDVLKPAEVEVTAPKLTVYGEPDTDSENLGTVRKGTKMMLLATEASGKWAYVELNGRYGWCSADALKRTEAQLPDVEDALDELLKNAVPAEVNKDTNVYAKPDTSLRPVKVRKGMRVNLLALSGEWALIHNPSNDACAYILSEDITPIEGANPDYLPAKVSSEKVDVYAKADAGSEYLGTIKRGTKVNFISMDAKRWAYIERDGALGYCDASALTLDGHSKPLAPADISKPALAEVIDREITIYLLASTSSDALGTLKKGAQVKLLAVEGKWAYVERNGYYGWCDASSLKVKEDDPLAGYTKETFSATTVTTGAKLFKTASASSASQKVAQGTDVTVTAYDPTWAYVTVGKEKGFMYCADLSRTKYAALSKGSDSSAVSTLEKALLALGYFDLVPNSKYDNYTEDAVKRFQSGNGFAADGAASESLQRVLYSGNVKESPLLSASVGKGDKNENVRRVQMRLHALGYFAKSGSVDGDFGTKSYNAVKLFQEVNGLSATGKADSATLRKLYSTAAKPLPSNKHPADDSSGTIVDPSPGNQKDGVDWISDSLASKTSRYSPDMSNREKLEYIIYVAQNQLGKKYVWGTEGPNTFDCSGLIYYAYKKIGMTMPRTAYSLGYSKKYERVKSVSDLIRGDLVYFNTVSDNDLCDHVGIYLGAGWFLHASSGKGKVVVSYIGSGYYNRAFSWGHHILQ